MASQLKNNLDTKLSNASLLFILLGLILTWLQWNNMSKTEYGTGLYWIGGITGILVAILLTKLLKKIKPSLYENSQVANTIHFSVYAGFLLIFGGLCILLNSSFAIKNETCKEYPLVRRETRSEKTGRHFIEVPYLIIKTENSPEEPFRVNDELYDKAITLKNVELCKRKGLLGFTYVTDIHSKDFIHLEN